MQTLLSYLIFALLIGVGRPANVLELNDKFLDIYKRDHSRSWLIKFYAPWCAHCRQIGKILLVFLSLATVFQIYSLIYSLIEILPTIFKEQTYNELGDLVKQVGIPNMMVGKIDCTKYTSMASHFGVRGFPTIMYIDAQKKVEFVGDRNKDEMLEFVKRLSGPPIRQLGACEDVERVKKQHNVFFIEFSDRPSLNYSESAEQFHSTDWFYHLDKECANFGFNSIYCVKPSLRNSAVLNRFNPEALQLNDWIRLERFPKFMRIGISNMHYLLNTKKILAIALLAESKIGRFASKQDREYYEHLEQLANSYPHQDRFVFGWTNQLDMMNSIAIQTIEPIPNYIFINSSTMNFYLYDGQNENQLESQLTKILDGFVTDLPILQVQGGNTYLNRFKRLGYDGFAAVSMMFESNPILTCILFGLPITFFSVIVYCSCCSDMLDGKDFDDEEEPDEEAEENSEENYNELEEDEELNEEEMIDYESREEDESTGHLKSE